MPQVVQLVDVAIGPFLGLRQQQALSAKGNSDDDDDSDMEVVCEV